MPFEQKLDFARRIALAAGEQAIRIRREGISPETKADASPVTRADKENERLISDAIEAEFPDDGMLGEEGSGKRSTNGRRWIIDPIDGTRDFVRGNRFWCVLLALEADGEPAAGVAHFPLLQETYWATRTGGAFRNGERLYASSVTSIDECAFNPNGLYLAETRPYLMQVAGLCQRSWSVRSYGGALDACMVASGQTDVWFEPKVAPWDLAPLKLILEESGAAFFALDDSRSIERGNAIGCTPGLVDHVCEAFGVQR